MRYSISEEVKVNEGFDCVKQGVYRMRIAELMEEKPTSKGDIGQQVRLEHIAAPGELDCFSTDGTVRKAQTPGSVFYWICLSEGKWDKGGDKQANLKALVMSAGLDPKDFDTLDLVNQEVEVYLGVETTYTKDGQVVPCEPKNVVKRVIINK